MDLEALWWPKYAQDPVKYQTNEREKTKKVKQGFNKTKTTNL
jgi:hypothetical protein